MNILVTGGTGFLGKHLVRKLLEKQNVVRVVDLEPFEDPRFEDKNVEFILGDCARLDVMDRACANIDIVIHAASAPPNQSNQIIEHTDYYGTVHTLEAAKKQDVKRFIYISTTAVYGIPETVPISEEGPYNRVGRYGQTKRRAEKKCIEYSDDMFISILRPRTLVGAERMGMLEILFEWIRRGKKIPLLGNGENQYQLLDVNDLCEAIWLTCIHPDADDIFNVGAEEFNTINHDLRPLFEEAENDRGFLYLPAKPTQAFLTLLEWMNLSPIVSWQYNTLDKEYRVNTTKIRHTLGWEPQKSNRESIMTSFRWYMQHSEEFEKRSGVTNQVPWSQKLLRWIRTLFG